MAHEEKFQRLEELREASRQGGGPKAVERQHERGKLTARERIEVLLDATSTPPRMISWRDMTHLGRGYSPDILGAQDAGL